MQLSVLVVQLVAGAVVMQYRVLNVTTLSQTSGEWLHQWASVVVVSVFQFLTIYFTLSADMMDSLT